MQLNFIVLTSLENILNIRDKKKIIMIIIKEGKKYNPINNGFKSLVMTTFMNITKLTGRGITYIRLRSSNLK